MKSQGEHINTWEWEKETTNNSCSWFFLLFYVYLFCSCCCCCCWLIFRCWMQIALSGLITYINSDAISHFIRTWLSVSNKFSAIMSRSTSDLTSVFTQQIKNQQFHFRMQRGVWMPHTNSRRAIFVYFCFFPSFFCSHSTFQE